MKKIFSLIAIAAASLAFVACSNCENKEACEENNNQETAEQEITKDLQDGTPVEVDVENAEVIDQPNGTQEVQTEVAVTPEQAQ